MRGRWQENGCISREVFPGCLALGCSESEGKSEHEGEGIDADIEWPRGRDVPALFAERGEVFGEVEGKWGWHVGPHFKHLREGPMGSCNCSCNGMISPQQ